MDLSRAFVEFAQLGANWVLWLLIVLSIISVGVMIDRALWLRNRDTDTERFTRELRGAFERDEIDRLEAKYATKKPATSFWNVAEPKKKRQMQLKVNTHYY